MVNVLGFCTSLSQLHHGSFTKKTSSVAMSFFQAPMSKCTYMLPLCGHHLEAYIFIEVSCQSSCVLTTKNVVERLAD